MIVRVADAVARTIVYRLNLLGIRVWENSCQLIARGSGDNWSTIGPRLDLPVWIPQDTNELKAAAADTLRLMAYQYNAERPGSDLEAVLSKSGGFSIALNVSLTAAAIHAGRDAAGVACVSRTVGNLCRGLA